MTLFRVIVALFALVMIAFGLVLTISPIPFGIIIVTVALLLFASAAPGPVRFVRRYWRGFDRFMQALERRLPAFIARRLHESDYEHEDEKEEQEGKPAKTAG